MLSVDRVKIGIIGCGHIGQRHAQKTLQSKNAHLEAICDVNATTLSLCKKMFKVKKAYKDFSFLLNDNDIQAVIIAVPNNKHFEITQQALKQGKHVLCEKPIALNLDEALKMKELASQYQKLLAIGFVYRYDLGINEVKKIISQGLIGEIYHIYASFKSTKKKPQQKWFAHKNEAGGGVMIDRGVHFLDVIHFCVENINYSSVFGALHSEYSKLLDNSNDVENYATALFRCSNGLTISMEGAWEYYGDNEEYIDFYGVRGGVRLFLNGRYIFIDGQSNQTKEYICNDAETDMYLLQIEDFCQSIKTGKPCRNDINKTIHSQYAVEFFYKSCESRVELKIGVSQMCR